jgi:uncharacterized protein YndB with AHSA1/START domain
VIAFANSLERSVTIRAERETVFRFFTDSNRWAAWWGAGSTIDARTGGEIFIRHPGGVEVTGKVLEIVPPERIVFTYGYASGTPIPPGSSRVTIHLEDDDDGTRLRLTHEFADAAVRDEHVQGWRYQLSVFSNLVANEAHANHAGLIDGWFAAWAVTDAGERETALLNVAAAGVEFRDRFSAISGVAELVPHIGAMHRFMAGLRLQRAGDIRHCQGTALADWTATTADGQPRGSGTNVFDFGADGKVRSVVGLWNL